MLKIIRYTSKLLLATALRDSTSEFGARLKEFEASVGTSRCGSAPVSGAELVACSKYVWRGGKSGCMDSTTKVDARGRMAFEASVVCRQWVPAPLGPGTPPFVAEPVALFTGEGVYRT